MTLKRRSFFRHVLQAWNRSARTLSERGYARPFADWLNAMTGKGYFFLLLISYFTI